MKITPEDHARIAEAVAAAEAGTSGEIRCVLASQSSDHLRSATVWAAGSALLLPAAALLLGFRPEALTRLFGGWTIAHLAARDAQIVTALTTYIGLQTAVFIVAFLLASWPALRRLLTPRAVKARRVHAATLEQFVSLGLHRTRDRTGVLLYASLAEHRAEVFADDGIYAKAPPEVWNEVVDLLVAGLRRGSPADGFVAAVERTGQILAACLPPRGDDANELPDALTERP
jgi:putative membrane protein